MLPLWENARPDDDTPRNLLAKVEQILAGMYQSSEEEVGRFWSYMDGVAAETQGRPPVGVGYAAVEALYTAVADEDFDPSAIDYDLTDEDVDPYEHDTAFAAAAPQLDFLPLYFCGLLGLGLTGSIVAITQYYTDYTFGKV